MIRKVSLDSLLASTSCMPVLSRVSSQTINSTIQIRKGKTINKSTNILKICQTWTTQLTFSNTCARLLLTLWWAEIPMTAALLQKMIQVQNTWPFLSWLPLSFVLGILSFCTAAMNIISGPNKEARSKLDIWLGVKRKTKKRMRESVCHPCWTSHIFKRRSWLWKAKRNRDKRCLRISSSVREVLRLSQALKLTWWSEDLDLLRGMID